MTDLKRIYQSDLPSRAIAVYLYLRGRANREGVCWPAIPTMARELKMSESTIRRALRDLVREGFLVIEERQRGERGGFVEQICLEHNTHRIYYFKKIIFLIGNSLTQK